MVNDDDSLPEYQYLELRSDWSLNESAIYDSSWPWEDSFFLHYVSVCTQILPHILTFLEIPIQEF